MNSVQRRVNCPLCRQNNFKVVYKFKPHRYNHKYYYTPSWDGGLEVGLDIVKCRSCNFKYQNPIFKDEDLFLLYPEDTVPENLTSKDFGDFSSIVNLVKKYINLDRTEVFSVDIGTRVGGLPKILQENGISAIGIEMNEACVRAATKYGVNNIYCGRIDNISDILLKHGKKDIDLVTLIDVIEHLTNPNQDFSLISSFQKSGQLLLLTTMFDDSLGRFFFGKEWYYIHGQHTLYFSKKTIVQFLNKFGYEVIKIEAIPLYKSFKQLPKGYIKFLKHKLNLLIGTKFVPRKWFAEDRPECQDMMTIIARKK
jgi:hypothetical protein